MGISTRCAACRATFKVADRYAGKRVRCPLCGSPVEISTTAATLDESSGVDVSADLDWMAQAEREAEGVYEPVTAECPHCGSEVKTTTQFLRRRVECPTCEEKFRLRRSRGKSMFEEEEESSPLPRWVHVATGGLTRREQERGKPFSAEDPRWSKVLAGLNLMYVGLCVQAGVAVVVLGAVVAALVGLLVMILLVAGAGTAMKGGSGGAYCGGFFVVLAGATLCAVLRVALAMDRFKETVIALPFFFVLAIVGAATEGKAFLARFLQFDFESTVIVRGWVGVLSVWHHAPCGC